MARTWFLLAGATLLLACTPMVYDGGPGSPVRLDVPREVGWEPGGPFKLQMMIHNATGRRMMIVKPDPEALDVKVYQADGKLACKTLNPVVKSYEGTSLRGIPSSMGLRLEADLGPYCTKLKPGLYRYEATYVANRANSSEIVWMGRLGPQGGRIAIGEGFSRDDGLLAAALAAPTPGAPAPDGAQAAEPTAGATPADGATAAATPPAAAKPAEPPPSPESVRACVDRELAARGLNAYGDPQGTQYGDRPPVDEGGRVLYVASRNPALRLACKIPGF